MSVSGSVSFKGSACKSSDRLAYGQDVFGRVRKRNRQAQFCCMDFIGERILARQDPAHGLLPVRRHRVMDFGLYAMGQEMLAQCIAARMADRENMEYVVLVAAPRRRYHVLRQRIEVDIRKPALMRRQGIQMAQLYLKQRRLHLVKARIDAHIAVVIFFLRTVVAKMLQAVGKVVVISHHSPRIAESSEVLGRVEAEAAGVAERSGHSAPSLAPCDWAQSSTT